MGDLNSDGNLDFAAANRDSNTVGLRLGNGAGGFSTAPDLSTGNWLSAVQMGDFNKDGKLDLAATEFRAPDNNEGAVRIWLGDGSGTFVLHSRVVLPTYPVSLTLADFNGDGNLDFANDYNNADNVSISVRYGDGSGGLSSGTEITDGVAQNILFPNKLRAGDFNEDGNQDILHPNSLIGVNGQHLPGNVALWLGNGTGGFIWQATLRVGPNPQNVVTGDFNGDGKLDFATANANSDTFLLRLGDGAGNFTAAPEVITVGVRLLTIGVSWLIDEPLLTR